LAHFENQGEPIEDSIRVTDCAPEKRRCVAMGMGALCIDYWHAVGDKDKNSRGKLGKERKD
jgi:hypothetical protein